MNSPLLKPELMQRELNKPWAANQVTKALSNMLYWVRNGYKFSEEQQEQLCMLCEMLKGENDGQG